MTNNLQNNGRSGDSTHSVMVAADSLKLLCGFSAQWQLTENTLSACSYSALTPLNRKWTARHSVPTVGVIFNVDKIQLFSGEV